VLIPLALAPVLIANRERIFNLVSAKGLSNWDRQQEVLAKRPILPSLESIQKGYPKQESIDYREEREGDLVAHLILECGDNASSTDPGSWGTTSAQGNSVSPPQFEAKAEPFQIRVENTSRTLGKIVAFKLKMALNIHCIPYSDPRWSTWDDWMDARVGRGKLSLPERVYWSYMHEMDHFQVYHEFWRFIVGRIFLMINAVYPSVAHAEAEIENFRKNLTFNFFKSRKKSLVFDQVARGLPQAGGRFGDFEFTKSETFFWQNQDEWTSEALTKNDKDYQSKMQKLPQIDALAPWLCEQMKKPGGLAELKAIVESRKTDRPGVWK